MTADLAIKSFPFLCEGLRLHYHLLSLKRLFGKKNTLAYLFGALETVKKFFIIILTPGPMSYAFYRYFLQMFTTS